MLGLPEKDEQPRGRFASSVLVITVPILLLALLALVSGGGGSLGTRANSAGSAQTPQQNPPSYFHAQAGSGCSLKSEPSP